jgi:hypothetical protein
VAGLTAGGHKIRRVARVKRGSLRSRAVLTRHGHLQHGLRYRTHKHHLRAPGAGTPGAHSAGGGGRSTRGRQPVSAATRAKLSAAAKGRHPSAATRAKLSAAAKGRKVSAATRAKLSAARAGKHLSASTKTKIAAAMTGRHLSASTKAKISAANKGRHRTSLRHR